MTSHRETSRDYQARADAEAVAASRSAAAGARERHEVARDNWQRLADQARAFEEARASRPSA
jgi:hypothetical protein